jgi:hypothetical protein
MAADCTTFDQIESRTATSVALAIYSRRVRDSIVAIALGNPLLKVLNLRLSQLKIPLRCGALEKFSPEQLSEVAVLLKSLNASLRRLDDSGFNSHRYVRAQLDKVAENVDDFESILENIYLALDPGFKKAVSSAISKLNIGVEESAAMLR